MSCVSIKSRHQNLSQPFENVYIFQICFSIQISRSLIVKIWSGKSEEVLVRWQKFFPKNILSWWKSLLDEYYHGKFRGKVTKFSIFYSWMLYSTLICNSNGSLLNSNILNLKFLNSNYKLLNRGKIYESLARRRNFSPTKFSPIHQWTYNYDHYCLILKDILVS